MNAPLRVPTNNATDIRLPPWRAGVYQIKCSIRVRKRWSREPPSVAGGDTPRAPSSLVVRVLCRARGDFEAGLVSTKHALRKRRPGGGPRGPSTCRLAHRGRPAASPLVGRGRPPVPTEAGDPPPPRGSPPR